MTKAPFPWTGGKSEAASLVWNALGDVSHYIEPFGGSAAVLLARPSKPKIETVNDLDHYLINFWRAVQSDPVSVARHAVNPQSEADLYARNKRLVETSAEFRAKILNDPDYYDAKLAGWWVWGQSTIIGRPFANDVCSKMPVLTANGVNGHRVRDDLGRVMEALAQRMRGVRILCGAWDRCLGDLSLGKTSSGLIRTVGVFLDPPYLAGDFKYANSDKGSKVWQDVLQWAQQHGSQENLRIVLAGYALDVAMPEGWTTVTWKGHGGLGRKSNGGNQNRDEETLWVSPHCEKASEEIRYFD